MSDRKLIRPKPEAAFSQAVRVGEFIAVSGQVPVDADGTLVGEGDPVRQARQCLVNLAEVLGEAGAGLDDVVRLNVYVTSTEAYQGYLVAKRESFANVLPAGTAVVVAALLRPGFLLEVEALAVVAAGDR